MGFFTTLVSVFDSNIGHDVERQMPMHTYHARQSDAQRNYNADQLGGPTGTGYAMPGARVGDGSVGNSQSAAAFRCAAAVGAGAGAGFVGGAAGGTAIGNAYCNGLPHPVAKGACQAASSFIGGGAGAYKFGKEAASSPFCGGVQTPF